MTQADRFHSEADRFHGEAEAGAPAAGGAPEFGAPVRGPAYSRGFRISATALLAVVLLLAARNYEQWLALTRAQDGGFIGAAGILVLIGSYAVLMRSVTTIDAAGIRQSGLLEKRADWSELQSARLVGFGFARRLLVHTAFGKFRVFYGGTPELAAAFERIAARFAAR